MRVAVGETAAIVVTCSDTVTGHVVDVVALDGTVKVSPTATPSGATVTIPLDQTYTTDLDTLTVTLTAVLGSKVETHQVTIEIVGSHWLSIPQLRAEQGLDDPIRYPDGLIADVRDEWADYLDDLCGRAFVPRLVRETHPAGRIVVRHPDPRQIVAATIDGVDMTTPPAVAPDGVTGLTAVRDAILYVSTWYRSTPPPMLVREARKAIGRELLMRSAVSQHDRISETFGEGGTIRYSTPDPRAGRWTGMLSLDPVITQYQAPRAGFA